MSGVTLETMALSIDAIIVQLVFFLVHTIGLLRFEPSYTQVIPPTALTSRSISGVLPWYFSRFEGRGTTAPTISCATSKRSCRCRSCRASSAITPATIRSLWTAIWRIFIRSRDFLSFLTALWTFRRYPRAEPDQYRRCTLFFASIGMWHLYTVIFNWWHFRKCIKFICSRKIPDE